MAHDKSISMKEEFFKFKLRAGELRHTVQDHFTRILTQIKGDFPEIKEGKGKKKCADSSDDEGPVSVNKKIQWSCFICTASNTDTQQKCMVCQAPRDFAS
jgi:hypothetical protein